MISDTNYSHTMNLAWTIAHMNFTDDDGSLPGIAFAHLVPDSVRALVDYFLKNGTIATENPTVYDYTREADVPLNQAEDPRGLVLSGVADSFACCIGGLSYGGVTIPDLGLFVFPNYVEIDYRMGKEWTPQNVDAFFRLLACLKSLTPEAVVDSTDCEGLPYPKEFKTALDRYTAFQEAERCPPS